MIFLVGTGLSKGDLTQKAIETCAKGELFLDKYTSKVNGETLTAIKKSTGKVPTTLSRSEMEERAQELVEKAKEKDIVIIVGGDPLIATTHKILFLAARKKGVKVEVVHAGSIFTAAIGESGLDFYKFGKTFTIPKWSDHYKPVSFYETLMKNRSIGAHTLALLDYDSEKESSMAINEALAELESAEKQYGKGLVTDKTEIFVMSNLCQPNETKEYIRFGEAKAKNHESGPALLIIPSQLSDIEREIVETMYAD
jgi:diphthine synthase